MSLRMAILHCLSLAPRTGVPEFALKIETRLRLQRTPGETEWATEIEAMADKGWVQRDTDPVTDDPHLTITEAGMKAFKRAA